jgi:hypothetical protein
MWLAVLHHLSITGAVPLQLAVETMVGLAPWSILEWVDRSDPQVSLLLSGLEEGERVYDESTFRKAVDAVGRVVDEHPISDTKTLFLVERG